MSIVCTARQYVYLHLEQVESGTALSWPNCSSETLLIMAHLDSLLLSVTRLLQLWSILLVCRWLVWPLVRGNLLLILIFSGIVLVVSVWSTKKQSPNGGRKLLVFSGINGTSKAFQKKMMLNKSKKLFHKAVWKVGWRYSRFQNHNKFQEMSLYRFNGHHIAFRLCIGKNLAIKDIGIYRFIGLCSLCIR